MSTLLKQINGEVQDFQTKQVQIVPGLRFNQHETTQKIYYYYNSKFQSGDIDDEGDRKYFLNISKNPCKIFTKAIDFDTKNIGMLTAGGGDPLKTWFMERDLKYWMRDQQFGKTLNRIFRELPIFGSVVLKVVSGKPYFIDLRNFIVQQSADDLGCSNYITEIHNMTVSEFRSTAKQMNWKQVDIDKVIEEFHKMKNTSHIRLYERYGEVEEDAPEGKKNYPYKRVFFADVGVDEFDNYGALKAQHAGIELSSDDWTQEETNDLYWEFHSEKIPGRWLGVGVVETLFEPQIKENETVNLESKMAHFLALFLFQTRDPAVNRNYLTDARNGALLNVDSEITQVVIQDRNGAFWNDQHAKWKQNVDELTVAFAPVGHSVIAIQVAQDQVVSYFEQIQEDVAMQVKELLYQVIVPQFEKENTAEHTLRLVGQDLDQYIAMVKNEMVFQEIIRVATTTNKFPTNQDKETFGIAIEEAIKQGKEKILTVPKSYYKDVKYDIDIDITGESLDTKAKIAAQFAVLQAITADPTMTTDPVKKGILMDIAEENGINISKYFTASKSPADVMPAANLPPTTTGSRAGGGVSAPNPGLASGLPGQKTATVAA